MPSASEPQAFEDASAASTKYNASKPSSVSPKWNAGAGDEEKLERIITQKWIAMFPNGQEAWSEFRRTGYPKVIPIVNNLSGGKVDTNVQVRRMTFPRSGTRTMPPAWRLPPHCSAGRYRRYETLVG